MLVLVHVIRDVDNRKVKSMNDAAKKAWAHIAHRDGVWCAFISAEISENPTYEQRAKWKKKVAKELASWIVDDWQVLTVYSREEYESALSAMRMYNKKIDFVQPKLALL